MQFLRSINWVTALFLALTPLAAAVWGGVQVSRFGVHPCEVALFAVYVAATGFSITAGYHRHFAHGETHAAEGLADLPERAALADLRARPAAATA